MTKIRVWFYTNKEFINNNEDDSNFEFDEYQYDNEINSVVSNICEMIGKILDTQSDTALYHGDGEQRYYYDILTANNIVYDDLGCVDDKIGIIEGSEQEHDVIYSYEIIENE